MVHVVSENFVKLTNSQSPFGCSQISKFSYSKFKDIKQIPMEMQKLLEVLKF